MNKILFYCGLFIASQTFAMDVLEANINTEESVNISEFAEDKGCHRRHCRPCRPCCPRGPTGVTGPTGPITPGPTGPTGPVGTFFEINDVIEATLHTDGLELVANQLVPFTSPIVNPTNGLNVPFPGGMELVESVPASGIFDTINLPIETAATLYLVTFGITLSPTSGEGSNFGDFLLVLNGTNLPYTVLSLDTPSTLFSNTTIISNPANTAGTLSLLSLSAVTDISDPSDLGLAAYISVVKLNNNSP